MSLRNAFLSLRPVLTGKVQAQCLKSSAALFVRFTWTKSKSSPTYYTLFPKTFPDGPPPAGPFEVPAAALRKEYLGLQALNHPDRQGPDATEAERIAAENKSSQLSVAYRTLLSPLRRSQHLIACREGVVDPLSEDAGSPMTEAKEQEEEETEAEAVSSSGVIDEDFLMDVLMAREAAEEASSAEEVKGLIKENNQKMQETEQGLNEAFKSDDMAKATDLTRQLSYWVGINKQLQEVLENFE